MPLLQTHKLARAIAIRNSSLPVFNPTGGKQCPNDRCAVYCEALSRNCPGTFATQDVCMTFCGQRGTGWWALDEALTVSGDNGNCRLYWAAKAGGPGNATACDSAGQNSVMCQ